jgi:hypothetical protein
LTSICPTCLKPTRVELDPPPVEVACGCGVKRPLTASPSMREKRIVDVCALCSSGYFYVEKSFNRWVGFVVVTVAILVFVWLITVNWFIAMGVLLGAALLDAVAYAISGDRTICYQCLAEYTGGVRNPDHGAYDLGTAGRFTDDYETERTRERTK